MPKLKEITPNKGFTLVELLVVVVILAILAAIVVPQFTSSTDDAKVSALKANLANMRGAIELYASQHVGSYPGATGTDAAGCATAFKEQLTKYSDQKGTVSATRTASATTYKYGPYIKGTTLPANPFQGTAATYDPVDVTCEYSETSLTPTSLGVDGKTGWKFFVKTGKLIANDGNTIDGTATSSF